MDLTLVLMCGIVLVSLLPLRPGENDFSGNGEDDNMDIDHSLPASNNILVHNTFHLSPRDKLATTDIMDDRDDLTQIQDTPNMRTSVNDRFNSQIESTRLNTRSDHIILMEERINALMQSNKNVVNMISALDMKVNRILQTIENGPENARSSAKNNFNFMDSLEFGNKLNNIHQYITTISKAGSTSSRPLRPELLEPHQIRVINHFMTALANANKSLRDFTPNAFSEVLANSRRTIQAMDKVANNIQVINERTNRIFDASRYQSEDIGSNRIPNDNMVGDARRDYLMSNIYCRSPRTRRVNKGGVYERTNRNMRNANKVHYEPNKYNCHDLRTRRSGVYKFGEDEVSNEAGRFFNERYCDFNTDGVAWTVIQRRFKNDHQENFNRTWMDYKLGFGELDQEFWFGNDFIHKLTSDEDVELRIILEDDSGRREWAEYSLFKVDSEDNHYNLMIGGYRGSIPDNFLYHNDQEFSTYDRQNDNNDNVSCASSYGSGWWYSNCTEASNRDYKGILWDYWLGSNFLKSSKMLVRPKGLWNDEDGNEKEEYI